MRREPTSRTSPGASSAREPDDGTPAEELRAWNAMAYVITGPVMFGGIGLGLDHWLGTSWLVAVGILGGMALSLYLVWVRYGTQ
ncbi:hypothetical protein BN12_1150013 [Nostocoides japonicum T1-X7]|uniref:ATP synthase protein I n=2 Tax=Nostocoides japonicum TaxID=99481 RepID=A0A077LWD0_9MICO|nr:hypothetical protein BN12_1150013 [Tetrasphaera japonica T1-X7]